MMRMKRVEAPESKAFRKMHWGKVEERLGKEEERIVLPIGMVSPQAYLMFAGKVMEEHPEWSLEFEYDSDEVSRRTEMTIRKVSPTSPSPTLEVEPSSPPLLFNRIFE